jgi:serine protease Do
MENLENKPEITEFKSGKKFQRGPVIGIIILTIILASFFGALFGFMAGSSGSVLFSRIDKEIQQVFPNWKKNPELQSIQKDVIIQEESAITEVVERVSPSVVSIVVSRDVPKFRNYFDSPFNFFFDPYGSQDNDSSSETEKQKIGGGSGFVVSADGMIITNKHVVSDAQADYTVILNNEKEYSAKVLARDPASDIAVIKIEGNNLPTVTLGDSDNIKVGQNAIAIGNSLGEFSNSVSKGIISGVKRNVIAGSILGGNTERLTNIIQTDAAINPGNSGGPLLNIRGEVIGVNVAMAQGAENIGFALPINQVKKIITQVKENGQISTPFLGVRYVIIGQALQKQNSLPFDYGVLVTRGQTVGDLAVIPGSPADKAGIVENDIILEADGQKIDGNNQLTDMIAKHNVGEQMNLKIWHKGETKSVTVKLEERK